MRETVSKFHCGRLDAEPDGLLPDRIFVEFMREGDEEQHFDMTMEEARAFRDWLNTFVDNRLPQEKTHA